MTARARALAAAMRRAGVPPAGDLATIEGFLALIDPDGLPDVVDEELIAQVAEWVGELGALAGEMAEAMKVCETQSTAIAWAPYARRCWWRSPCPWRLAPIRATAHQSPS